MFYHPIIRSQYFSGTACLGCDLKCFSVSISNVGDTGRLEGARLRYLFSPTVARLWWSSFPWGKLKNRKFHVYFKMVTFPHSLWQAWRFFLQSSSWEHREALRDKIHESRAPPETECPWWRFLLSNWEFEIHTEHLTICQLYI